MLRPAAQEHERGEREQCHWTRATESENTESRVIENRATARSVAHLFLTLSGHIEPITSEQEQIDAVMP